MYRKTFLTVSYSLFRKSILIACIHTQRHEMAKLLCMHENLIKSLFTFRFLCLVQNPYKVFVSTYLRLARSEMLILTKLFPSHIIIS
jgi:hypothetical protein